MQSPSASAGLAERPLIAEFRAATKLYGKVLAADALTFGIGQGEFLSFLGPSGCGKTTALRMLAGFETPTSGDIYLDGERITEVPAYRRPVNMVFQHYALFPHLSVADNIGYGLLQRRPRPDRAEVARKVDRALEMVRLSGFGPRRIWEMSGGQQQRGAIARALVQKAKIILADEPVASLDPVSARRVMDILRELNRTDGLTVVVTLHQVDYALRYCDRVVALKAGHVVYDGPASGLKTEQLIDIYGPEFEDVFWEGAPT
jgi:spermidine/putrescine transport system ATP-binding protein